MPIPQSGEFDLKIKHKNISEDNNTEEVVFEKKAPHFYSSLCRFPSDVFFQSQDEDEEIVLLVRRDFITNLPWILGAILLLLVPFVISLVFPVFFPFISISESGIIVSGLFYYLIIFGLVLVNFSIWYFNVGLVTNKRVIDLDVSGILYKHVSETRLNLIEDVTYTQIGSIRSIFNYGDIFIQTAGAHPNFEFDRSPEPAKIVRIIANMIGEREKEK